MDNLGILIQAILSLKDTTASKNQIAKDLPKLENQLQSDKNTRVKIIAGLDVNKSKSLIQSQLNTITNQAKAPTIKVGVDVAGTNGNNLKPEIKPILDRTAFKDIESYINAIAGKLSQVKIADPSSIVKNIKDSLGVNSPEVKNAVTELVNALKLTPNNKAAIVDSYQNLIESIRGTIDSSKIVNDKNFEKNLADEIYRSATAFKDVQTQAQQTSSSVVNNLQQIQAQATQTGNAMSSVFGVGHFGKQANEYVHSQHQIRTTFDDTLNVVKEAEAYFQKFGTVSVDSVEQLGRNGALKQFTVNVESATGAVEKFKYVATNIGDNQNPVKIFELQNVDASNAGIQRLIDTQTKLQDKTKALRINLTSDLKSIRSAWQDVNGGKSVKSDENITKLNQQYIKTAQAIRALHNADTTTMTSMKANADAQIDKLNQMVAQYHNAEKVATQLRAKGFETVKIDTGNNIDKFINSINNSKVPIQAIQTEIDKLTKDFAELDSIQDQAGKSAGLTNILNTLDNAQTKFQSLKELFKGFGNANWFTVNSEQINKISDMATKVAIYKQYLTSTRDEWKTQGIYVGEIQSKMASLARSLPNIKKPEKFDKWVSEWNELNQQANRLKTNLDSQVVTQNRIYEIQSQIAKLNPNKDANRIANLNGELQAEQQKLQNLQMQSKVYTNLLSFEEQEKYITEQTVQARKLLNDVNAGQADKATQQRTADMKAYQKQIETAISSLNQLNNSTVFRNNSSNPQVAQTKQELVSLRAEYQQLLTQLQSNPTSQGLETLRTKLTELDNRMKTAVNSAKAFQDQLRSDNSTDQLRKKVELLTRQMKAYQATNTKAAKAYKQQFSDMFAILSNPNIDNQAFTTVQKQFQALRQEAIATGKAGKTMFQTIGDAVKKFAGWMSMTYLVSSFARSLRDMVNNVIELDTAMTNLKKVTNETEATYSKFLKNTSKQAKELHSTIIDLVEQVATWSKLGYSLSQAEHLAKVSMIYSKVGEVDNTTSVSDLVTVMKAFNIESEKSIHIVDSLNQLGNSFATDAKSLGEGLTKSSSALNAANNSFEQSIALLTGGTEITQNASEMGNALKTISMRIRGMKGELEELGEEYENVESISKIQTQILNLTGGHTNIFDDNGNFKSTYDILKSISEVYDNLTDPDRAELTEILFGKMRGNQGIALIQAFQSGQIEKAYESALNSAGSAQKEFDAWSKSIEAHINTFKASWESLSQTVMESDFLKGIVDLGTTIISTLDSIIDKFGTIPTLLTSIATVGAFKNVGGTNKTRPFLYSHNFICIENETRFKIRLSNCWDDYAKAL